MNEYAERKQLFECFTTRNGVIMTRLAYAILHSYSWDVGNASMQKNGRTKWNEEDWNAAVQEFNRIEALYEKNMEGK